jgi:hypothetical protein
MANLEFALEPKPEIVPKKYLGRIRRYPRAVLRSSFRAATFSPDLGITQYPVSQSSRK